MNDPVAKFLRRSAWRLAKALTQDLAAKAAPGMESTALDQLLGFTGSGLKVDWVGLAFNSRYGGRFKPAGAFGALYAALSEPAALDEAVYNWTRTFACSSDRKPPGTRVTLQTLRLRLTGGFTDVRNGNPALHDPGSHAASQAYGFQAQSRGDDGIVYRSVRAWPRGTCVVVFRRAVVVACEEAGQRFLAWDGVAFRAESDAAVQADPLEGLLSGGPDLDKHELRKAQHGRRLARKS